MVSELEKEHTTLWIVGGHEREGRDNQRNTGLNTSSLPEFGFGVMPSKCASSE